MIEECRRCGKAAFPTDAHWDPESERYVRVYVCDDGHKTTIEEGEDENHDDEEE